MSLEKLKDLWNFNGAAHFCARRAVPKDAHRDLDQVLQWGRALLRAESANIGGKEYPQVDFNGAAHFCARRGTR